MGLDMYLSAEKYVSGYPFQREAGNDEPARYDLILETLGMRGLASVDSPSLTVSVNVAYWRKANQVHAWFVENVQDGVDECQRSHVSLDQLQELVELCKAAIAAYDAGDKDAAAELMTPASGFFFGSQDIDEYYRADLQATVDQIEPFLPKVQEDGSVVTAEGQFDFYYQSSW